MIVDCKLFKNRGKTGKENVMTNIIDGKMTVNHKKQETDLPSSCHFLLHTRHKTQTRLLLLELQAVALLLNIGTNISITQQSRS
jgi:hypothetical protein